jgi:putative ABC transport system substrate-binding protein
MNRREVLGMLAAMASAAAGNSVAQGTSIARVGWVSGDREAGNSGFVAFKAGMRELGYVEGRNFVIEARWGDGSLPALEPLVATLVQSRPDVVVTQGPAVRVVRQAGTTLPVVFAFSGDPVAAGYVESFARPGRNMTGVSFLSLDLVGKRMELLKEAMPGLRRVAILANPEHPGEPAELRVSNAAAAKLGLTVDYFQVRSATELEQALAGVATAKSGAIVLFPDAGMMRHAERVAAFAERQRVPAISGWAVFARHGNLMSYGPNLDDGVRRLASYVDRILKGAKPADLPVELPSKIELVVNLKAARTLGLTISQSLLLRADEVIE